MQRVSVKEASIVIEIPLSQARSIVQSLEYQAKALQNWSMVNIFDTLVRFVHENEGS